MPCNPHEGPNITAACPQPRKKSHALDFDLDSAIEPKIFFYWRDPVFIIVDEAQCLTKIRQQTRLKTMPPRPELTLVFCTNEPEALDAAILDRYVKIRLGPLADPENCRSL